MSAHGRERCVSYFVCWSWQGVDPQRNGPDDEAGDMNQRQAVMRVQMIDRQYY